MHLNGMFSAMDNDQSRKLGEVTGFPTRRDCRIAADSLLWEKGEKAGKGDFLRGNLSANLHLFWSAVFVASSIGSMANCFQDSNVPLYFSLQKQNAQQYNINISRQDR
jgi:hypothetical protein